METRNGLLKYLVIFNILLPVVEECNYTFNKWLYTMVIMSRLPTGITTYVYTVNIKDCSKITHHQQLPILYTDYQYFKYIELYTKLSVFMSNNFSLQGNLIMHSDQVKWKRCEHMAENEDKLLEHLREARAATCPCQTKTRQTLE